MIKLQQRTIQPDDNRLRLIAKNIMNELYKDMLIDNTKVEQLRELNATAPLKALKAVINEIVGIINNIGLQEAKRGESENGI